MSSGTHRGLRNLPNSKGETLVDLLARRPELRDVGIAGYLVDSALNDEGGAMRGWRWYLAFRDMPKECSGACLSAGDLGLPFGGIAYPHPDCPKHGDDWRPFENDWSREYVAAHPERFGGAA